MSQFFESGGQSIGVSASASVLPVNTQEWSPCSPRDSQESSSTPQFKGINSSALSFLYSPNLITIHDYWKNQSIDYTDFVDKVMSLFFSMLPRLDITFFPRSKRLLISWLQPPSAVVLEPKRIKAVTVYIVFRSICHEVMVQDAMILVFWMLNFKPTFHSLLSLSSRGS